MSAETTRKHSKQGFNGQTVLPQPVNDPSIIESVAGFIHEVVPQAYSSVLPGDTKESILWARFESCDFNDPENYPQITECESDSVPPLLLILGYGAGAQIWSISGGGDATEVLSWSQGSVKTLRILNKPRDDEPDPLSDKRPLAAIVDSAGTGPQFCTVNFVSLKTAETIKSIKFKTPICDIFCNRKSIVITFVEKIAIFDVATFEDRMTITTCYPSPGIHLNPIALGHRWLAYADKQLSTWQRSSGGSEGDGAQSYTATAIHAVKTLGKGLRDLSGSLTGNASHPVNNNTAQPGVVTIVDIETKPSKEEETDNIIAHFVAHVGPIVAMTFDSSGLLLITADKHGHKFHVFRVHPHPVASQLAAVHHLYILHRGETTAKVQDITVSWDSRWVAVSSVRGTTHVFPITPYGGPVTVRTHTTPNVVNKLSRFERSAGLSDGRGSPLLEVPSQPLNPRLPPYPHPAILSALAQLRRTPLGEEFPLAAVFGPARAWIPGKPRGKKPISESLFVISSSGTLIQYDLDPKCIPGVAKDKISYDTGIDLGVEAKAEWSLLKPPHSSNVQPPLVPNNPLLVTKLPLKHENISLNDDRWLSQVEIVTHTGPHRRLWMGPQFSFKSIDPLPPSEGDYSENINPIRSNPVNMPLRPYLLIEGGSGGSIDSPFLTGYGSSTEDLGHGESRLREDLADAMMEPTAQNTGVVGGVRLKAAKLERQVNPLGTVITLPSDEQLLYHQQQHLQQQRQCIRLPPELESNVSEPSTSKMQPKVDDVKKDSNISLNRDLINKNSIFDKQSDNVENFLIEESLEQKTPSKEGKTKGKSKKKNKNLKQEISELKQEIPCPIIDICVSNVLPETKKENELICNLEDTPSLDVQVDDSESNSDPLTAIAVSRDMSENDIKSVDLSVSISHTAEFDPTDDLISLKDCDTPNLVNTEDVDLIQISETKCIEISSNDIPDFESEPQTNLDDATSSGSRIDESSDDKNYDFTKLEKKRKIKLGKKTVSEEKNEEVIDTEILSDEIIDGKKTKKDRSRKIRSEVVEIKNKSPSPVKSDSKPDTDSSDEAIGKDLENILKQPKRKRGKKPDEDETQSEIIVEREPKLKNKSKSEGTLDVEKSDYETCSEKKSDSSVESFPDLKKKNDPNGNVQDKKSWSSIVKNTKEPLKPSNSAEDRDSVYESCNDDEYPALEHPNNFEPKDDSDKQEIVKTESGSSNTEEKTDSGDKESGSTPLPSLKKIKKQKKKRR